MINFLQVFDVFDLKEASQFHASFSHSGREEEEEEEKGGSFQGGST